MNHDESVNAYPVHVDEATGDNSVKLERIRPEDTTQRKQSGEQEKTAKALENDRKFYEEERKASHKLSLKPLAKEKLEGMEIVCGPGEAAIIPPGHDAWVEGNEPCIGIDFTGAKTYGQR